MKTLRRVLTLVLIVSAGLSAVNAQTTSKDKKAAKQAAVKNSIDSRNFTFIADIAIPSHGGSKQLSYGYEMRITPDSVISFLPFYGEAYFDVPYPGGEGGIKFTSTKFEYKATERKKGGWEILIQPKDVKNTISLRFNISSDGYSSLAVNTVNRSYISFNGYVDSKDKN